MNRYPPRDRFLAIVARQDAEKPEGTTRVSPRRPPRQACRAYIPVTPPTGLAARVYRQPPPQHASRQAGSRQPAGAGIAANQLPAGPPLAHLAANPGQPAAGTSVKCRAGTAPPLS